LGPDFIGSSAVARAKDSRLVTAMNACASGAVTTSVHDKPEVTNSTA
jgi:hypothetical protein